jgi:biofilm PGA synthesis N-glycosyltransferase PgaC
VSEFFTALSGNIFYVVSMWFLALFPIIIAALAVNSSRQYRLDRRRLRTEDLEPHLSDLFVARERWPVVSVVIPARNEEKHIANVLRSVLELRWPQLEVIVINDGSTDGTAAELAAFVDVQGLSVITHDEAHGKSESLNEAFAAATSDIVLILDADARPAKNVLNRMVPHFLKNPDVVAVTGNPRVVNVRTLWTKLQAIEFSSTISTLRRGQSAWGRVNTFSGIMTVFQRYAVINHGGFSPTQPTEDIELTWRFHRMGHRVIYEPAAQVGMVVPESFGAWWQQRLRWSRGLVRVVQAHGYPIIRKWEWPVLPIVLEAFLSILWCHILILATIGWIITYYAGLPEIGNSMVLGRWGTMTVGVALVQILWGMYLDAHHDKSISKLWWLAPIYPLFYWWFSAFVVVVTTIPTLLTKPKLSTWNKVRQPSVTTARQAQSA